MTETLSQLAEKYGLLRAYRMSLSAGVAAWGWVHDRMWPIYSTGVLVSVLCMLASAQEKQILADHLYGSNPGFEADREKNLTAARTLFHEESAQGVKQVVWMLPRDDFHREYVDRHGKRHTMAGIAPTPNAAGPSTNAYLANDRFARIFEELLDAEVSENPEKLCEASRAGIPPLYRSTVYRYLLGIAFIDKSREMTLERMQEKDFEQLEQTFARIALSGGDRARRPIAKGIVMHPIHFHDSDGVPLIMRDDNIFANGYRSAEGHSSDSYTVWLKVHANFRYLPRFSGNHERRQRMESAWRALFVVYSGVKPDEVRNILDIALSFELVHDSARDIFFSVQSLYHILTHHGNMLQNAQFLQQQCGTFLMLFRATNFELYRHFVSEGVAVVDWLPGMLSTLLAGRLHEEDLLRLWDIYLADAFENMCFPLHPYVCLAILADMTEILIECEKSGIIERLRHIPRIRTGNIIHKAISLKESVYSKGLL